MQGCIIAYDAPPPAKLLILFSFIFALSNDLRAAIFLAFCEESAQPK